MTRAARRELAVVSALCAAGSALVLLAAGRSWLTLSLPRPLPLPDLTLAVSGSDLEPLVPALGLVGLAGVVALLATRGWGRLAVGVVLATAGLAVVARSVPHLAAPAAAEARRLLVESGRVGSFLASAPAAARVQPGWPLLAAAGGLALLAGGLGTVLRSRRWPAMSRRYEPPGSQAEPRIWEALDRGEDPTR